MKEIKIRFQMILIINAKKTEISQNGNKIMILNVMSKS